MTRPWITPSVVTTLAAAVPRRASILWFYLWARADKGTSKTYPSVRTIAGELGIKPGHVCEDVKLLEAAGWLLVDRDGGKSEYTILAPSEVCPETGTPPPDSVSQNGNNVCPETGTPCIPKREHGVPQNGNAILTLPRTLPENITKARGKAAAVPPSLEEVEAYCQERHNNVDADQFLDYYQTRGWKLKGGQRMTDWRAAIRTWERNNFASDRKSAFSGPVEVSDDDFFQ